MKNNTNDYPPEARVVRDMLSGNTNPLVTITFLEKPSPLLVRKGLDYPRSMGFVVERFRKGLRLVVTCKHAVSFFSTRAYMSTVAFKNPKITTLTCMGSPIPDPESESDIAFLLVHDPLNAPTQPFTLHAGNFQITDGMTLYNARNQCDPFRRTYKVDVTSQTVRDRRQIVFCKFSQKNTHVVPIENLNERVQFEQQGFIGCRALTMVSRPGYSGSPIWDNQLHLYGMDVRGSTPSDNAYAEDGDITVCLPTAEMYAARQRIDSILQKRLSLM